MNKISRLTHRTIAAWILTISLFTGTCLFSACASTQNPFWRLTGEEQAQNVLPLPRSKAHIFYFLQSELNKKNGDIDKALEYMNKALSEDPDSLYLKMGLARLLVYKNDIPQAISIIQEGLEQQPENTDLLSILAQIKLLQNKEDEVPPIFETILTIKPDDQAVYYLLGGLYSKMNQTQKAIDTFKRLTDHFPESFSGHYYLGKLYVVDGNYGAAEKELSEAYRLNSDLVEALYGLIQVNEIQHKNEPIAGLYRQILDRDPDDIKASLALALIYHADKKNKQALVILSELGVRSKDDPDVLRHVVRHYIKRSLYPDAIFLIEGLLKTATQKDDFYYFLGLCHEESKNTLAATQAFEHVSAQSKYYEKAVLIIAFHYMDINENAKAIAILEQALEAVPENIEFMLYLGSFYEDQEMYQKAVDMYLHGLTLDQNSTKLYFRLGVVYDKKGDRTSCIEEMKKVISLDPEDANALNYLGYTYADMGMNLEEAEGLIKRALHFKPDDGYITDSLGWLYFKKGHYKKAVATLEKAVDLIPNDPILLEHLGDAFNKTADPKKALEFYQRSLQNKKKDVEQLKHKIDNLINKKTSLNP